jgi:SAM-dependent methyltransferase
MILTSALRDLFRRRDVPANLPPKPPTDAAPTVLNVGGNSKQIPIPEHYGGWRHLLLDIDPTGEPDVLCDARELLSLDAGQFDAVYCSHNLEHYYRHDVMKVLRGFLHVLRPGGFAEVRVPDLQAVMQHVVATGMDVEDTLYVAAGGPITVRDVIYGWGKQIEESGVDFYAHKTGFTPAALTAVLEKAGFARVFIAVFTEAFEVRALAFKMEPTEAQCRLLGLATAGGG